jgi:hypothetical protein
MTAEHLLAQWWATKMTLDSATQACLEAAERLDGMNGGTPGKGSGQPSDDMLSDRIQQLEDARDRWGQLADEREDVLRRIDRIISQMLFMATDDKGLRKMQRIHAVICRYYRDGVMSDSTIAKEMGLSENTIHAARIQGISILTDIMGVQRWE